MAREGRVRDVVAEAGVVGQVQAEGAISRSGAGGDGPGVARSGANVGDGWGAEETGVHQGEIAGGEAADRCGEVDLPRRARGIGRAGTQATERDDGGIRALDGGDSGVG